MSEDIKLYYIKRNEDLKGWQVFNPDDKLEAFYPVKDKAQFWCDIKNHELLKEANTISPEIIKELKEKFDKIKDEELNF
jgi:hypothetical protein